ncbi:protein of unknown function [Magnetospira sp. QH-2]|nr:protein of unknown function [Magnetospira sp. QH-2]
MDSNQPLFGAPWKVFDLPSPPPDIPFPEPGHKPGLSYFEALFIKNPSTGLPLIGGSEAERSLPVAEKPHLAGVIPQTQESLRGFIHRRDLEYLNESASEWSDATPNQFTARTS